MPKRPRFQNAYNRPQKTKRHARRVAARAKPLDLLRATLDQMLRATSLDDLLERTTLTLHEILGNSVTAVLQLLPKGSTLYGRTVQSTRPYGGSLMLSIHKGLVGAAARSQQTVLANNVAADPRHVLAAGWDTHAELCVPIITHQGLWGILNL